MVIFIFLQFFGGKVTLLSCTNTMTTTSLWTHARFWFHVWSGVCRRRLQTRAGTAETRQRCQQVLIPLCGHSFLFSPTLVLPVPPCLISLVLSNVLMPHLVLWHHLSLFPCLSFFSETMWQKLKQLYGCLQFKSVLICLSGFLLFLVGN